MLSNEETPFPFVHRPSLALYPVLCRAWNWLRGARRTHSHTLANLATHLDTWDLSLTYGAIALPSHIITYTQKCIATGEALKETGESLHIIVFLDLWTIWVFHHLNIFTLCSPLIFRRTQLGARNPPPHHQTSVLPSDPFLVPVVPWVLASLGCAVWQPLCCTLYNNVWVKLLETPWPFGNSAHKWTHSKPCQDKM